MQTSPAVYPPGKPALGDETELVRQRYDRIAAIYDLLESGMELRARKWRAELWTRVPPGLGA